MQPGYWNPPRELSALEERIVKRIKRAKLFVFLRTYRHEVFDEAFQRELARGYQESAVGQPPVPPAQLALAIILQAYTGVSDDEVIEALVMDRRWQLVLDCLDSDTAPFSKGTLVNFRTRLIAHEWDRRLIERTVEVAAQHQIFSPRALRAALDSSPLWGAGRVEDTDNLLGHALRKALGVLARQQGRGLTEVAAEAGAEVVAGTSLKAAVDLDWDDPAQQGQALQVILHTLEGVEGYLTPQPLTEKSARTVARALAAAQQVCEQDITPTATGEPTVRQGVAKDRRISIEDEAMRHGRKSKSQLIDGYKRHVLRDLDSGLVRAVGLTRANEPEASVTDAIEADLKDQQVEWRELHIDRAYLSSTLVRTRSAELTIYCKAWPVRSGAHYPKTAFQLDWETMHIRGPTEIDVPFTLGGTVCFPTETCASCPLRRHCTESASGRHVSIHPDERLLQELRERQLTPAGRAKLRERVAVEHDLAHIGHWQGDRARYLGRRKNLFDLRRTAVVSNLHLIARAGQAPDALAA